MSAERHYSAGRRQRAVVLGTIDRRDEPDGEERDQRSEVGGQKTVFRIADLRKHRAPVKWSPRRISRGRHRA